MRNFAIVEFCEENTIDMVPKSWIDVSQEEVNI